MDPDTGIGVLGSSSTHFSIHLLHFCNQHSGLLTGTSFRASVNRVMILQAEKLREKLLSMKISKDALWVSSPMTRALETMLIGCPQAHRIGAIDKPLNVAVRR